MRNKKKIFIKALARFFTKVTQCDYSVLRHATNEGVQRGYQRGLDDWGGDQTDNPDVTRMQILEKNKGTFGFNVELSAWGMDYESPWFPTLRELADYLIEYEK